MPGLVLLHVVALKKPDLMALHCRLIFNLQTGHGIFFVPREIIQFLNGFKIITDFFHFGLGHLFLGKY